MKRFNPFAVASLVFAITLMTGGAGASSLDPSAVISTWSSEGTPGDAIIGNLPPAATWSRSEFRSSNTLKWGRILISWGGYLSG